MKKGKDKKAKDLAEKLEPGTLEAHIAGLRKKFGKSVVAIAKNVPLPGRISTGMPELDIALKGGLPMGRISEVWGPESSGKSSFLCKVIAALQKAKPNAKIAYYDLENTFDHVWAAQQGVDIERLLVIKGVPVDDFEPAFLMMIRDKWDMVIIDSVVEVLPERELVKASDTGTVGVLAGVLSRMLPKIIVLQSMSPTAVILTNQVRDKIGYYFGGGKGSPGGHALAHDVSLKLRVQRKDKLLGRDLTDEMKQALGLKGKVQGDREFGYIMALRVVKSKVSREGEECRIPVLFDLGVWSGKSLAIANQEEENGKGTEGSGQLDSAAKS